MTWFTVVLFIFMWIVMVIMLGAFAYRGIKYAWGYFHERNRN